MPSARANSIESRGRAPQNILRNLRVLLVEDEALIALDLELFAQEQDAEVAHLAPSLGDAWHFAERCRYDLAIVDVMLPDGLSIELARFLAQRGTAVIFHSGHAEGGSLRLAVPDAQVCPKPCTRMRLCEAVAAALRASGRGGNDRPPLRVVSGAAS